LEPEAGVNASVELAHQVISICHFADEDQGTTVTPTVLSAGTTTNSVPESARVHIDVRGWTGSELQRVDHALRRLAPHLRDAAIEVNGGINRYPMEPSTSAQLVAIAQQAAADLGLEELRTVQVGGASDGNFTAAIGIPTLDGLGAVGGNPHARSEWVDISTLPDRTALLATLINRICE
jgi:glutamate carboxypeptidase